MKYCEEFAALLDAYADGELNEQEAARVRAHLETCAGCRMYVENIRAIRAAFPSTEETDVPDGFADGVMAAIRAGAAPRRQKRTQWLKVAVSLAACVAILVVVGSFQNSFRFAGKSTSSAATSADSSMEGPVYKEAQGDTSSGLSGGTESDTASESAGTVAPRMFTALAPRDSKDAAGQDQASGSAASSQESGEDGSQPAETPQMGILAVTPSTTIAGNSSSPEEQYRKVLYLDTATAGTLLDNYTGTISSAADGTPETLYEMSEQDFEAIAAQLPNVPVTENSSSATELCCVIVTYAD